MEMEAIYYSQATAGFHHTARCYLPADRTIHRQLRNPQTQHQYHLFSSRVFTVAIQEKTVT
jgi:hypothetical protein